MIQVNPLKTGLMLLFVLIFIGMYEPSIQLIITLFINVALYIGIDICSTLDYKKIYSVVSKLYLLSLIPLLYFIYLHFH